MFANVSIDSLIHLFIGNLYTAAQSKKRNKTELNLKTTLTDNSRENPAWEFFSERARHLVPTWQQHQSGLSQHDGRRRRRHAPTVGGAASLSQLLIWDF